MEGRQELIYESLRKSLTALATVKPPIPELAPLREDLENAIREVDDLRAIQHFLTKRRTGSGPEVTILRDEIGRRLRQISHLAAVHLKGLPGLKEEFRPPRMNSKNAQFLEGTARLIRNARPHIETLQERGLPRDSIERLEALTSELATLVSAPNLELAKRSRATNAIPHALKKGRDVVRAIDSSIRVHLPADSTSLHVWERSKRIPGKPGRPKGKRRKNGAK
jgi:hypothetical protein